ncbi:HlyD family type I secretion periplasmic adaptor subunit [Phenylobacterium immobile]|uniref:HlyD family type I secretion periplasmic adaptor subunit n=1 Tax=Phenylobacterium immobile TaxID=21 RepID=UPI000AABA33C|nr:HlyD family type I secretion periplasmic adaptor subunit [Phenylobacterium immobile]
MKIDFGPFKGRPAPRAGEEDFSAPVFAGDDRTDARMEARLRRPMVVGGLVIAVMVVGLGLWASLAPLATGITAPGEVRVEANRKTVRHREPGTVRKILVREGQHVAVNQPLIIFDDVEARAAYDVFQNQYDTLATQAARLTAEATMRPSVTFPPDLMARTSADPKLATMLRDQQFLFTTRQQLFESQASVLGQRVQQIQQQVEGDEAQLASVEEQRKLTADEMAGYQELYEKGYAPRNLILRYQRTLADLAGRKGSLQADKARLQQQMGETRMQLNTLRDQRQSQAAEELRDTASKQADMGSRLAAARQTLESTVVRSPADGYVFSLTQFTVGGVTAGGEKLMEIVPANTPLIVSAMIRPDDVNEVRAGMDARVKLAGISARWTNPLPAKVMVVSADKIVNEEANSSGYRVDLRIDPKDLHMLKDGAELQPGLPVSVLIVTGKQTIMSYLISPIIDTFHDAFRER